MRRDFPPLLLNHGTVWVNVEVEANANPHYSMQAEGALPCAAVQIPNTWTVCCWLTETIANALLGNFEKNLKFTLDIFEKLIAALVAFYEETKAPNMLKSIISNLLSRLIIRLRYIYSTVKKELTLDER